MPGVAQAMTQRTCVFKRAQQHGMLAPGNGQGAGAAASGNEQPVVRNRLATAEDHTAGGGLIASTVSPRRSVTLRSAYRVPVWK